jgi:hypothetical protein
VETPVQHIIGIRWKIGTLAQKCDTDGKDARQAQWLRVRITAAAAKPAEQSEEAGTCAAGSFVARVFIRFTTCSMTGGVN